MTARQPAGHLHDRRLRHLPIALDPAAMHAKLQALLFGPDSPMQIRACHIERVRYKPEQNCLIGYRLEVENRAAQVRTEQRLTARLYEAGGSASPYARAKKAGAGLSPAGLGLLALAPVFHLPALDMVVWVFPHDRKLVGLPQLVDPGCLHTDLLPRLITEHLGADWRLAAASHQVAHYNPEHTCMIRVRYRAQNQSTGEVRHEVVYGKIYADDEGAETYRVMSQLWQPDGPRPGGLRTAQPLAYLPELTLLWQRECAGQTLLALDIGSREFRLGLQRAAAALAEFHQTPIVCQRSGSIDDWIDKLKVMRAWLPAIRESCRPALEAVVDRLIAQRSQMDEQPAAILHGDLHLQNFLCDGDQVALIDLDNVYTGSPWQDVGSLVAGLLYGGLAFDLPGRQAWDLAAVFCDAYQQNVPWRISPQALNWFIAAALIHERAFRCITRLKDGRHDLVDRLVELAAQISAGKAYELVVPAAAV
jgi:hypothetical protein